VDDGLDAAIAQTDVDGPVLQIFVWIRQKRRLILVNQIFKEITSAQLSEGQGFSFSLTLF
jgi:hypothetical protein